MQQDERIWKEGRTTLVRGRAGQATSLLLTVFAFGFTLLMLLWILMVNQLVLAPAGQGWMLGDSPAHIAGWAAAVLTAGFLSVILVRLLVFRGALAWRTVRIQVRPAGLDIDGRLLPYAALETLTVEGSPALSSPGVWRIGVFALLFLPLDGLACLIFGRMFPDRFTPLPHRVYWVKFGQVPLRLYTGDLAIAQALQVSVMGLVSDRPAPPIGRAETI
jgi:hypothetical protein